MRTYRLNLTPKPGELFARLSLILNQGLIYLCLLFFISFPLYAATNNSTSFTVKGISGKVQANVELRLKELTLQKPFNELSQDEISDQVNQALQPYGYLKAHILIKDNHLIRIQPGPQLSITALSIQLIGEGSQNPLLLSTLKNLSLKVGSPLLMEQYNQAKQDLLNKAESLGYLHADFKKAAILIDENKYTSQIHLILNTGPLYYFGQIQFDPTNINPELLHRFVPFHPGQPYSTDQVLQLNNTLSKSGYFSSVLVKPQITKINKVPIQVHLTPVSKYSYFLGAGYGTDTGIRGRAGLNIIPVNRRGHQFNAQALGSMNQNIVQARYLIPGSNPVTDQYSLTGNLSTLNYDSGYSNASLLTLAQRHNLEKYQRTFSINGLYESFHYTSQPNSYQFLLYPKAAFTFKRNSNALFSPSGYNITFNALGSSKTALSHINMTQFSVDAKAALMIEFLRLRLYGHTIQGITSVNDINQLPLTLALLLGGTDNLKAYGFNSIGPGKTISYAGFEIQKETIKNWYLVGFYDAGAVYNPTPKQILQDVGASLMWVSSIGPIKLGLAQGINTRFQRTGGFRLVINMGPDL